LLRWLRFRSPGDPRHDLGAWGEQRAAAYLKAHGHKILYRNYRAPGGGEVDLVCRDRRENMLVFVEVKTRTSVEGGRPSEAVNRDKQYLIARGAMSWLKLLDKPEVIYRFDIVEVVVGESEPVHIRDAFLLPAPYRF